MRKVITTGRRFTGRGSRSEKREKRTYDGIVFDSIAEMNHYRDVLKPLYTGGKIRDLEYHPVFVFEGFVDEDGKPLRWELDFQFKEAPDWNVVVQDVKAWTTDDRGRARYLCDPQYKWQKALMLHCFGIRVEEV